LRRRFPPILATDSMNRAFLRASALVLGCLLGASVPCARAQAQDVGASQTMFDKGVADMQQGRYATACPEIAESLRLDPRAGTLFTLAECYAKAGKTASAVARYQDYLDQYARMTPDQQGKQQDRPQVAERQRSALTPLRPMLTLRLPPGAPADTEVKRDGEVLGGPSLALALPVDPGAHVVTTQISGGAVSSQTITLAAGEKKDVVLVVSTSPAGAPLAPGAPPQGADEPGRGNAQRIAGFVIGGVGAVGVIVGAITGGITLSKRSTIKKSCDLDSKICKDAASVNDANSAKTTGTISTIGFVAGGVLLAGGIVIVLTAPHGGAPSAPAAGAPPSAMRDRE